MLCVDPYSNIAWVGLSNGVVTGYNLLDNVATHYLYSTGVNLVGNYASCGCMLSSVNHVTSIEPGILCASPYNIDFLSRTGGTPVAVLAKDAFSNMPEDSHIVTSLLGGDSINLSVSNYLLAIDPNNGRQISCATLASPIVALASYTGESSTSGCGLYSAKAVGEINTPSGLYSSKSNFSRFPFNPLVAVGTLGGEIELFDFRENESVARIRSHKSRILGLSCNNFYIASVGLSVQGIYEPIVRLHDLRMLKSHTNWLGLPVNMVEFVNDNNYIAAGLDHYHICNINGKTVSRKVHNLRPGEHMQTTILSFSFRRNSLIILHDDYTITSEKLDKFKDDQNPEFKFLKADFSSFSLFRTQKNGTEYPQLLSHSNDDHSNVIAQFLFFCPDVIGICTHVCLIENCLACMLASALKILVTQDKDKENKLRLLKKVGESESGSFKRLTGSCHKISSLVPKSSNIKTVRDDLVHLLDNIHKDLNVVSECTLIHDIFGVHLDINYKCPNNHITKVNRVYTSLRVNVATNTDKDGPDAEKNVINEKAATNEKDFTREKEGRKDSFIGILNETLYNASVARASCKTCSHVLPLEKRSRVTRFSNLILIECLGDSSVWMSEGFILGDFYAGFVEDGSGGYMRASCDSFAAGCSKYSLMAVLAFYNNASGISFGNDAMARIFGFKTKLIVYTRTESGWIVISGSHMDRADESEAVDFSNPFKLPVALVYRRERLEPVQEINPTQNNSESSVLDGNRLVPIPLPTVKCPVPCSIFLNDTNLAHNMESHKQALTFTPLTLAELGKINNGDFILALDIECVSGDVERRRFFRPFLTDTNFESNIELIPPKTPHIPILARVSMIRASGNMAGVPFIDHYIYHKLPPKDYLTKYSGLFCGDLDLRKSKHWLTTKKSIYLKTKYLVDSGCKFIGHGIINDFQILNIAVPVSQIIDTVELYHLPGERYISLQFLAAHVLRKKIQIHGHDSVQDAITSMELYNLFKGADQKGLANNIVKRLYQIGHNTNWKVPV